MQYLFEISHLLQNRVHRYKIQCQMIGEFMQIVELALLHLKDLNVAY